MHIRTEEYEELRMFNTLLLCLLFGFIHIQFGTGYDLNATGTQGTKDDTTKLKTKKNTLYYVHMPKPKLSG